MTAAEYSTSTDDTCAAEGANASPTVEPAGAASVCGFWRWTWSNTCTPPDGANLAIAFSGWSDHKTALEDSIHVKNSLAYKKYISLGGGNANGAFTSSSLAALTAAINAGTFAGYDGIAYDVEEGDSGLGLMFSDSFAAAKANGLEVLVTVSHSAPYGIGDANTLMHSFFADANIDYLSPQLYTSGNERANDYATSGSINWSQFAMAQAAIVPSIVSANMYQDAQVYFRQMGVPVAGFIQWSQT